jgi:2-phospho-L-lactate/phosphoenolpyruvate guanylyltransferase
LNKTAAIVPVKSAGKKSRLGGILDEGEREDFVRLLLMEVLGELKEAGLLRSTRVVSPDRGILDVAEQAGAGAIPEKAAAGFDTAVARGLRGVRGHPDVLIIPADLPLLKAPELIHLLEARSDGFDVAIAPSRAFDGTNAMLFSLSAPVPLSYDDDSFRNHLSGAARRGLSVKVCTEPGLTFDVDSPSDFKALARSGSKRPSAEFARRVMR